MELEAIGIEEDGIVEGFLVGVLFCGVEGQEEAIAIASGVGFYFDERGWGATLRGAIDDVEESVYFFSFRERGGNAAGLDIEIDKIRLLFFMFSSETFKASTKS